MYRKDCVGVTVFFFSSRRRHTSWPRDWSSDVCSSDLELGLDIEVGRMLTADWVPSRPARGAPMGVHFLFDAGVEIGRAACRERVEIAGVGGAVKGDEGRSMGWPRRCDARRLGRELKGG